MVEFEPVDLFRSNTLQVTYQLTVNVAKANVRKRHNTFKLSPQQ